MSGSIALVLAGILCVATLGVGCRTASTTSEQGGNIILIVVDTLRADHVGAYGSSLETPAMDELAANGQVFPNAVSSFHQTTMSMGAMLTGRTPSLESGTRDQPLQWSGNSFCGMARFGTGHPADRCIPTSIRTLAGSLRDAGYWTIGVVSNFLLFAPYGYERGFDDWREVGLSHEERASVSQREASEASSAPRVERNAMRALAAKPDGKFFLYLHYLDVHEWALEFLGPPLRSAEGRDGYGRHVEAFDKALGGFLERLAAEGWLENTTIVLTSDHGEMLDEVPAIDATVTHFGNPSFEPVLRVPLIVSPARVTETGRVLRSEDIPGLIHDIAGVPWRPVSGLAAGELLLTESEYQTYRSGRWKSMWPRDSDTVHLFDLESDPGEAVNVAASNPAVLEEHRRRVTVLTGSLSSAHRSEGMTDEDRRRLRAMGYIQ